MVEIFKLSGCISALEDGEYSNYLDLKLLRSEVRLLLEDEDEELQNWGKSVGSNGEHLPKGKWRIRILLLGG